ncbi:MAG: hypothetical protein R3F30_06020 [Planctomycetota bacterium]
MIRLQLLLTLLLLPACGSSKHEAPPSPDHEGSGHATGASGYVPAPLQDAREKHLRNIRQLTFGGENAEGYFSSDGKKLVFQARGGTTGFDCDQIFEFDLASNRTRLVSTGKGRTTCAYYHDGDRRILYASTHLGGDDCPEEPDHSQGYVWPLYDTYDIFSCPVGDPTDLTRLTSTPGYDAEATTCYANDRIVFTSVRDGDIELYSMDGKGGDVRRLTDSVGYDGGAFFSSDGAWLVWRAQVFADEAEVADYKRLLAKGLVRPTRMEIFVGHADGSGRRQVTSNGKANFAPFFLPDNRRVIFASNLEGPRTFHLYVVGVDGEGLERITWSSEFNSFPMFSPDGKYLVFASNRANARPRETNLFLAEWVD